MCLLLRANQIEARLQSRQTSVYFIVDFKKSCSLFNSFQSILKNPKSQNHEDTNGRITLIAFERICSNSKKFFKGKKEKFFCAGDTYILDCRIWLLDWDPKRIQALFGKCWLKYIIRAIKFSWDLTIWREPMNDRDCVLYMLLFLTFATMICHFIFHVLRFQNSSNFKYFSKLPRHTCKFHKTCSLRITAIHRTLQIPYQGVSCLKSWF